MILEYQNQLYWAPLSPSILSHGTLSSRFLKRSKSALTKSRVMALLFTVLLPLGILNSTISWSLQSRLSLTMRIPNEPFLVCKYEIQVTSPCWLLYHLCQEIINTIQEHSESCKSCCVAPPEVISVVEDPMKTRACKKQVTSSCLQKT